MLISSLLLPNPFPTVTSVINNLARSTGQAQQHLTSKDYLSPRQASASYSTMQGREKGWKDCDATHFSPDDKNKMTGEKNKMTEYYPTQVTKSEF